jgi:hypothetical protein
VNQNNQNGLNECLDAINERLDAINNRLDAIVAIVAIIVIHFHSKGS